jgi:uncharacterized membrane protein YidH (DUF202 family)
VAARTGVVKKSLISPIAEAADDDDDALIAIEEGAPTQTKDGLRKRLNLKAKKEPTIAPRSPARVEPKSFFANERTFIQWISAALLLMGVGELLFVSARESLSQSALVAGNFLFVVALVVVVYAGALFYRRLFLMTNAKPYGYSESSALLFSLCSSSRELDSSYGGRTRTSIFRTPPWSSKRECV